MLFFFFFFKYSFGDVPLILLLSYYFPPPLIFKSATGKLSKTAPVTHEIYFSFFFLAMGSEEISETPNLLNLRQTDSEPTGT